MADFKLFGSADPTAATLLGRMTEGLGFPLREVDESAPPALVVRSREVLRATSPVTQQPSATDTPLQLALTPVTTTEFDVSALGVITCLVTNEYAFRLRLQLGRTGNPGNSIMLMRALVNGVQVGNSVHAVLDDSDDVIPGTFTGVLALTAGDELTIEIVRDSSGVNAGGVFALAPALGDWANSPSVTVIATVNEIQAT